MEGMRGELGHPPRYYAVMPKSSMVDPYLKIGWAKKHLERLKDEVAKFRQDDPITASGHDDFERQLHCVKLHIKETPDAISLIAGDFIGCARAALDQLVWSLARLTIAEPERTGFPILETPPNDKWGRKNLETSLAGLPAEAKAVIIGFQPYIGREGDMAAIRSTLLWQLNKLVITDKHKRIPVNGSITHVNFLPGISATEAATLTFEDDNAMFFGPLTLKDKMSLNPEASIQVLFGDSTDMVPIDVDRLEKMHDFIANKILPGFAGLFK